MGGLEVPEKKRASAQLPRAQWKALNEVATLTGLLTVQGMRRSPWSG